RGANPGKLYYASAVVGTTSHLAGELLRMRTGIEATHVPYRGIAGSFADLTTGKVQFSFSSIPGAKPFTDDNRLRALASTGAQRSPAYPDLPTVSEPGCPASKLISGLPYSCRQRRLIRLRGTDGPSLAAERPTLSTTAVPHRGGGIRTSSVACSFVSGAASTLKAIASCIV
ncbi:MAG: hypothetical protein J2P54_04650, partial [Bradyrhizobiaceae bacterium]|nr:hypothetical protein [Bradyrhizobiaceae bacterium]